MMAFPTVLSSGFTLTLWTLTESAEVKKSGSVTIKRSIFGRMDDVDEGATYAQTGNIPGGNEAVEDDPEEHEW